MQKKLVCFVLVAIMLLKEEGNAEIESEHIYDFVIVGGGTSGAVLARRLSESGRHSILLLEAGEVPTPALDIPATTPEYLTNPNFVNIYTSVPQVGLGTDNGVVHYIMGRTLGGGSSVNGMLWNRGSPLDYDNWAKLSGNNGWNFENMLPYLKRPENYGGEFPSENHGFDGPISISRPKYSPGLKEWKAAGEELGFPYGDANGIQKISFTPDEFTLDAGRRVSAYEGYLKPVLGLRRNLKVITGATVRKIVFAGNRVEGVEYSTLGFSGIDVHLVAARKEVILSAGVIESPLLLMRSGVGPKEVLDATGIPAVKYLPVGENLQDHVEIKLGFIIDDKSKVHDARRDLTERNLHIYNATGDGKHGRSKKVINEDITTITGNFLSGPYSSFSAQVGQAFLVSSKSSNSNWPDIKLESISSPGIPGIFPEQSDPDLRTNEIFTHCRVTLGIPKSFGKLTLNTTNANGPPIIDFAYFSHPDDMEVMLEGINATFRIYEGTETFKGLGARYPQTPLEACRHFLFRSEDYWRCYTRQTSRTGLHSTGTCSMGKGPEDPKAVVDPKLKVIGVKGLRVVDASVIPAITNANILAPVYGVAEKASDLILEEWGA